MNYYPFHLGDYAAHTGHLEPMEDLAYRRLLDQYYLREGPLPADIQVTAKLIRMRSMVADVESVLNEFFIFTDSGWVHSRCESEIESMRDKQSMSETRDAHEKERMRRHRERRAEMFAALRVVNIVPAWDVPMKELQRLHDAYCNAPVTPDKKPETQPETDLQREQVISGAAPATAIPTPTPTPTPIKKNTSAIAPPDGVTESVWVDFCQLRKTKKATLTQTALDGIASEAKKAGWALDAALRECCARGWIGFKAEWVLPDREQETFKEKDARLAREKWERMTGEQHPENGPAPPVRSILDVFDVETKTLGLTQ